MNPNPDSGLVAIPLDLPVAQALRHISRAVVPEMPDRIIAAAPLYLGLPLVPAIVVLVILFFGLAVWLAFIVPQEHVFRHLELNPAKVPVSLGLTYPRYIGGGDQGSVNVTICNEAGCRPPDPASGQR